jgi:hypothetical protein
MKSARFFPLGVLILIFAFSTLLYADVPQMINYQGKITSPEGALIDSSLSMVFSIYDDEPDVSPAWAETLVVDVQKGIFSVVLGGVHPIPYNLFDGTVKYLGVKAGDDPEMTPRKEIVSVAYAYRAASVQSGGIDCADCDDRFVNVQGPDSVISSGSGSDTTYGIIARAENTSNGVVVSGFFETGSAGTGRHFGVYSRALGSSSENNRGFVGYADNTGDGWVHGGWFGADSSSGTGPRRGVEAQGKISSGGSTAQGLSAFGTNYSYGDAWGVFGRAKGGGGWSLGGFFITDSSGWFSRGVEAQANAYNDYDYATGVFGWAENSSASEAYGGFFHAPSVGSGIHYGVHASAEGFSDSSTYGSYGYAENASGGEVHGGFFETDPSGTGVHYGVRAEGYGSSSAKTYGCYGYAENTSTGEAYGGYFYADSSGTGTHYGLKAEAVGISSQSTYGSLNYARNTSTGTAIAGYFWTQDYGTGTHIGVSASAYGSSSSECRGVNATGLNSSTGNAIGGFFSTSNAGSGNHYAVYALGIGASSAISRGVYGYAANTSTGSAYGGYFVASSSGTGAKYGVWASAPVDQGYAGYFDGDVYIDDSLVVSGAKSAAVKVDNGEYRLLYCVESTENWFEDFGEGQLVNGRTTVDIDPLFGQTINANLTYHVFLTPGGECNGLSVINKSATSFEVRELQAGNSNVAFSYRIVAKRKGYEDIRLAKLGGPNPDEVAAQQAVHLAEMEQERERMEQEQAIMAIQSEEETAKISEQRLKRQEQREKVTQKRETTEEDKPSMHETDVR